MTTDNIDVLLLAGSRPGVDPLAARAGVPTKALVPIGGVAMVARVARTLVDHPRIRNVIIVAQQGAEVLAAQPDTQWLADHPSIRFAESSAGISASLLHLIEGGAVTLPALVTTADHVLLTGAMIDHMLSHVTAGVDDLAVAMVERDVLIGAYPANRRTWLKFRGGQWSGANLFWFGSARIANALRFWQSVERDRKKGIKIIAAFGPFLLLGAVLRLLRLDQALAIAGRRMGMSVKLVAMPMAEACIDADKPDDITLIETILRGCRPNP